tara:strand:- start:579 stop:752 length:174 start_codon:yes stop_codon:yes gene_type:complete
MVEETKDALDVIAGSTALLTVAAWVPPVAGIFSILWFSLRIWESDTVREITNRAKSD